MVDSDWAADFQVPEEIPKVAIEMAYVFSDHCEKLWEVMDFARSTHKLPAGPEPEESQPHLAAGAQAAGRQRARAAGDLNELVQSVKANVEKGGVGCNGIPTMEQNIHIAPENLLAFLRSLPLLEITVDAVFKTAQVVLHSPGRWFYYQLSSTLQRKLAKTAKPEAYTT